MHECILQQRELRADHQKKLLERFAKPLLVMRVNYPGPNKNSAVAQVIFNEMMPHILDTFEQTIIYREMLKTAEGESLLLLLDLDPIEIKSTAIAIEENHRLGRFIDLDVHLASGGQISRQEQGFPSRKCYLCQNEVAICNRSKAHTLEELEDYIKKAIDFGS